MVATLVDQIAHDAPHRHRAQAATVQRRVQEQVDPRAAVLRLVLLGELEQARDRAVNLDRQAGRLGLVPGKRLVRNVPPAHHLRRGVDAAQLGLVTGGERTQDQLSRPAGALRLRANVAVRVLVAQGLVGGHLVGLSASRRRDRP